MRAPIVSRGRDTDPLIAVGLAPAILLGAKSMGSGKQPAGYPPDLARDLGMIFKILFQRG